MVEPAAPPGPAREACGAYWKMSPMDDPGRYHLLLSVKGRPAMHGWWKTEPAALEQYRGWIGTWGRPGARVELVDTADGRVIHSWSEEA
ncbi:hypothetical protein ACFCYX_19685 [Streptomyces populi]|uniref:hypothetical protein n=1 Tax=Streptomyces populi TaxID=2058924 RepID=UPI0035E09D8B